MSFNDSPYMSIRFFDFLDYHYVAEAVSEKRWTKAVELKHMHRVVDDVVCFNTPQFFELMKGWGKITAWRRILDEPWQSNSVGVHQRE